ncbi:hypothetical protein RM549_04345 [Salegentibacter sp. F188]|uniref:Uncharacterized protein n=1 Tax=Autumnicola patrickiae TaxID=3075591 RepID=A0ABU3DZ77_9FLAO|nr:hypothetical protein [Salegentibacter sp. F188]MDT0689001.1 hypothetical protein [Salegentibacter sp. F188]
MNSREITLRILRSLKCKNLSHQKDYQQITQHADKLLIKSFFRNLSNQKENFVAKLQEAIEKTEKELAPDSKLYFSEVASEEKTTPLFKTSRHERHGLIKECYRREKRNLQLYNYALTHVNESGVREVLLSQKNKTKSWLREIKCMGIRIYEDVEGALEPSFEFDAELKA